MIDLRRIRWVRIALVAGYLSAMAWGISALAGCAKRAIAHAVVAAAEHPTAPRSVAQADDRVGTLRDEIAGLEHDLAVKHADLKVAQAQQDEIAKDALRSKAAWAAGLFALAGLACGVLVFVVPVAKGWMTTASLGCFAGVAMSLAFRALVPWLAPVGLGLLIVGLLFLVWKFKTAAKAGTTAFEMLEQAVTNLHPSETVNDAVRKAKTKAAAIQDMTGTRTLIAAIRGKPKPSKSLLPKAALP